MAGNSSNKRIAKNTMLLYVRMLLIMAVSLYTSRVVLNTLGVEDYGIFNVVGGIVTMFTFLNSAMITSTQRYLTFELGRNDHERLRLVFSTSIRIHTIIAIAIIVLTETIGVWFLYNKMVIPPERMTAAMFVLQFSVLTMAIRILSVPYNSLIIAHEDMGVFAVFSVLEVFLNLGVVYLLALSSIDKLIFYAALLASVQLLLRVLYALYCGRHYPESKIVKDKEKELFVEMGKFAGWNLWGNLASMLMGTGLNMLLNVFFGPAVNAARAVATQAESALVSFSSNFMIAVNPQITKYYAQKKLSEMHDLIFRSSKFSFFLLLVVSLPVMIETKMILTVWLKTVPDYTIQFLRLLLLITLANSISTSIQTSAAATGDVKKYQTIVGGILLAIVPISYIVLKLGCDPQSVYVVYLFVSIVAIVARLLVVRPLIKLSLKEFIYKVVLRCILVFLVSYILARLINTIMGQGLLWTIIDCVICSSIAAIVSYFIGMTTNERSFINGKLRALAQKVTKK